MSVPLRLYQRNFLKIAIHQNALCMSTQVGSTDKNIKDEEEFRVLQIRPSKVRTTRKRRRGSLSSWNPVSRNSRLDPDTMDWKSIWPGPRSFAPHTVPLPVRQGVVKLGKVPYEKFANLELMKIPNFLHLTPPAVKAHCEELKRFCTPFPPELDSKEKCEKHFPMTVIMNDYLHSSPSIRDPLARVVTLKVHLKDLPLDYHAKDKLLRLVGERYNPKQDAITIVTDRCPTRKQNYDYAHYLLTALFFESWKTESWEAEKTEEDMEKYVWENNASARTMATIMKWAPEKSGSNVIEDPLPETDLKPEHTEYKTAVSQIIEDESEEALKEYKKASSRLLLGIQS